MSIWFYLVNSLSFLADSADTEGTAWALRHGWQEGNTTLYGRHPSRLRMYLIGLPLDALWLGLSYYWANQYPSELYWAGLPLINALGHGILAARALHISLKKPPSE